jgi:hypothetical protein
MTISEKHDQVVKEFTEQGELSHNLKLLHFGALLLTVMGRHNCSLSEILDAINLASRKQIKLYELGRTIL